MVEDGAFGHKIDYITIFRDILNLKGHQNCITGPKVTAFLLNGWILPIGGASAVKGLRLHSASCAAGLLLNIQCKLRPALLVCSESPMGFSPFVHQQMAAGEGRWKSSQL